MTLTMTPKQKKGIAAIVTLIAGISIYLYMTSCGSPATEAAQPAADSVKVDTLIVVKADSSRLDTIKAK